MLAVLVGCLLVVGAAGLSSPSDDACYSSDLTIRAAERGSSRSELWVRPPGVGCVHTLEDGTVLTDRPSSAAFLLLLLLAGSS